MRVHTAVAFLTTSLLLTGVIRPVSLSGQSLSGRPVLFADPVPGRATPGRELELGSTTVEGAQRIFAVELDQAVQVRRGYSGNPSRISAGTEWRLMGHTLHPAQRLDLGPDHYALYFDTNQRLIGVFTDRLPRRVTRDELMMHYPKARLERRWHSGDVPFDQLVAPIGDCVVLSATVRVAEARVEQLGYYFTCATKP
ncbi:MAG TPA: hypothetical protein VIG08_04995 [Gemmatimonadales bacterium]|jgi:hypothetical protein